VLRQLGEVYAAKQRLGVDPELEIPFTIEGAIEVYAKLAVVDDDGWEELGYRSTGRESWVEAMRGLWEEIQETILTPPRTIWRAARSAAGGGENARHAARLYDRYLSFFERFATSERRGGVPDSAYFAAHEAARGVGDALLVYATRPMPDEIELATRRYRSALTIFPFDRRLWPALTGALERQGREPEYMELVRPVADWVTRSRSVDSWIAKAEPGAESIAALRRALSDSLVIMYLGFAEDSAVEQIEAGGRELRAERETVAEPARRARRERGAGPGAAAGGGGRGLAPWPGRAAGARFARLGGSHPAHPGGQRAAGKARQADRGALARAAAVPGHAGDRRSGGRAARAADPSDPRAAAADVSRETLVARAGSRRCRNFASNRRD
jgi:hypothetical protein